MKFIGDDSNVMNHFLHCLVPVGSSVVSEDVK